ncbi:MAG: hypothetical protein ACXABY_19450 [Candidatus Thorarchaeota archaeon]|jgi:hypothetical protein
MAWLVLHISDIIAILTGLVTVASIVAKLTPTEVDNRVVGNLLQLIDLFALNNKPTVIK